eukprot:CAMPEP_0172475728 /NCGR_PEP_ID=MMETSP1065-20121228/70016_1 /TAXON_ID=265537 /ORGANISM="Amphiprora paludosa, Strain CCMP125" /LENGTH=648 /DNA_ID=CAMNT_0013233941 /DNA_START=603 /DNA_END=2547 /DNA_ORIENTATION=+
MAFGGARLDSDQDHGGHESFATDTTVTDNIDHNNPSFLEMNRRSVLSLLVATAAGTSLTMGANAAEPLEQLALGQGEWIPLTTADSIDSDDDNETSAAFITYLARFLITYDAGVQQWWQDLTIKYSLLPASEQTQKLSLQFAALSKSIQQANLLSSFASPDRLWDWLVQQYASPITNADDSENVMRQISLLFALLPASLQPTQCLLSYIKGRKAIEMDSEASFPSWDTTSDFTSLLPSAYHCQVQADGKGVTIVPNIESSILTTEESATVAKTQQIPTPFGPLGATPLTRELPQYSTDIYTLLGISGAVGCALTHTVVIPLDVVKTRAQTNPEQLIVQVNDATTTGGTDDTAFVTKKKNIVTAAIDIVQTEGFDALLLGAQATIAGYFWYGLSVYPSYTFFKRFLTLEFIPPDIVVPQANNIALLAGALAAVVASLGLTPIEAARIRVVAEPDTYKPLGLIGTLQTIAEEDPNLGWRAVYAGLPSLLARQVIFGSVKFLAFERACEFIYAGWPFLRDLTWTSLAVSLVAGGCSGALSSVVSQPADSLLTFVAQNGSNNSGATINGERVGEGKDLSPATTKTMGLIEGCRIMIEQDGPGSLFRGLGSRCVWAGSIIAGQFLLYDVFRTYFHVSTNDLSQVYQVVVTIPS